MRNKTTQKYFQKIQHFLKYDKTVSPVNDLVHIPEIQLEALWNLICAGYPTSFAITNYIHLYEYVQNSSSDYSTAIKNLYSVFPGLIAGIYVKDLSWFESN